MSVIQQQQQASDPHWSVWVAANAGTGKTKVLTDRVLRLLLEGNPPEKILCLTYTKAAAAEMANRIHDALRQWVMMEEEALKDHLAGLTGGDVSAAKLTLARQLFTRVIDSPEGIRIVTIHALCQSLLRRFALEAGVSPFFRLMDDREVHSLLQEAKESLLRGPKMDDPLTAQKLQEALRRLSANMAESSFEDLLQLIIQQRAAFQRFLTYYTHQERSAAIFSAVGLPEDLQDVDALMQQHFRYSEAELAQLREDSATLMTSNKATDQKLAEGLAAWLRQSNWRNDAAIAPWIAQCLTKDGTATKRFITKDMRNDHPAMTERLLQEQAKCEAYYQQKLALQTAHYTQDLLTIAEILLALYAGLKSYHDYLDYEDLILHTHRLLQTPSVAPWVLYKLDGGIDHVLLDEAQDTSRMQWAVIEALVGEFFVQQPEHTAEKKHRTLFVVGDEKQSIYSFQGAEPRAFSEMRDDFSQRMKQVQHPFRPVNLDLSFRSTAAILQLVDSLLAQEECRDGVTFDMHANIRHQPYRNAAGRVELWPLITPEEQEARQPWTIPQQPKQARRPEEQLAEKIAQTIKGWLDKKRILPARQRPIVPQDIMILVRRRHGFFDALIKALKKANIPFAGADRLSLAEDIAVQDMLALARFLLLPEDDLNLACLLKSPLFNEDEEALFALCHGREGTLWDALRQSPAHTAVVAKLAGWLDQVDYLSPYALFVQVLEAEQGRSLFQQRLGQEVDDPLNELLSLALHYESKYPPSLQAFIHWFEQSEVEIKRDMEQVEGEVRVLTVHGSKGLQAPIVFLPDTTGTPTARDSIFWQGEVPLWSYDSSQDSLAIKHGKAARKKAELQEYRRLHYVALTRAADELYIAGWQGEKDISPDSWYAQARQAMQPIAEEGEDGVLWLENAGAEAPVTPKSSANLNEESLVEPIPAALLQMPAEEMPDALPEVPVLQDVLGLTESPFYDGASDKNRFRRGLAVHQLLEILSDIPASQQHAVAQMLLRQSMDGAEQEEQDALVQEVLAIIHAPDHAELFRAGSQAEVTIRATIEQQGQPVAFTGRIDRMVVLPDRVLIVDYKTQRNIPESSKNIPQKIRLQLQRYKAAISQLYPDKTIETAILWTAVPRWMVVEG